MIREPELQIITPKSPELRGLRKALLEHRRSRIADLDFSQVELRAVAWHIEQLNKEK